VAVSERAVREAFNALVRNFTFEDAGFEDFGAFAAGYDVKAHLEGGSIDLRGDNTIQVSELDLRWDRLKVILQLDIPEICVGGGCIDLPFPLPDLCLPRVCVFSDDPDVSISPDFASFVAQEISFSGGARIRYFDASVPPPADDLCDLIRIDPLPTTNQWQIFIDPETIDLDLFDFPDIVGDLIEDALTSVIEALIPGGFVRDLILAIIGGVVDLIRAILDIPDDIEEWLSDLFNVSFGLLDSLGTLAGEFFGLCNPVSAVDDPFEILPEDVEKGLIPVRVPIRNLTAQVNDVEMIVQADVGA
jgi:hypothetical protein